ncbi:hypothetical protein KDW19_26775 [Burkholderia cenocepacia]|uniref:hypothetical protein n=1 Tax=Burkholderia cepacia complex TaxID=87882 RepID=UPI00098184A5|nr:MULTISPECIES: hypothetical protein [Burkholderia cepacia complex]AQQ31157.1 hypothetical protein A8E96_01575 [Burkholderia cenocepacia]ELW9449790.1 hypothetical protein [Burkholderia cenocepacia]MBR8079458.1 hypothetical protein [Burkholderia cenocepacia]MBR8411771.1 hypothetical protein [Burkholderia cenocepacia]MBR8486069.1 hypothetical protein [Burkholderia cenocepacia]
MSIRVKPGMLRDIAETLGRHFEARAIPFHVEEQPAGALHIGFRVDGHPASLTVTFDADAFAALERADVDRQRGTLTRVAAEFDTMMARRAPTAYAGDFHFNRL